MTPDNRRSSPSDAELVAYLDGELSPADSVRISQQIAADSRLGGRIELLMKGMRPFREAFAPLLAEAPVDRLEAMLSGVLNGPAAAPGGLGSVLRAHWPVAVAAAVVLMVIGAGFDRVLVSPVATTLLSASSRADGSDDWRVAVAQYLSLYTSETLSIIPDTGAAKQQELASVGSRLGLDLTPARVELSDLPLKRAEMFDYDGKALGFLAYLDPRSGPVSLCIIAGVDADAPPKVEHRRGMNVVYWAQAHHGFMLIGRAGVDQLRLLATTVADRFGGSGSGKMTDDRG